MIGGGVLPGRVRFQVCWQSATHTPVGSVEDLDSSVLSPGSSGAGRLTPSMDDEPAYPETASISCCGAPRIFGVGDQIGADATNGGLYAGGSEHESLLVTNVEAACVGAARDRYGCTPNGMRGAARAGCEGGGFAG